MVVDLRQLAAFVAVARSGTYAAAAMQLHLAQPAVWKHVANLERALGVQLFERHGRLVRLTASGRAVLVRAEAVLEGAEAVETLARDLRSGRTGTVTIGCVAPHVVGFLAPVIGAYRKAHRDVRVLLRTVEPAGRGPTEPF